jgi:enamine deaminase RidA (YjgF/YER057c/UK114 family)
MPRFRVFLMVGLAALIAVALLSGAARKKKKKQDEEPPTQTLEIPKDPPSAITAEASRLSFHTAPLSAKGLLSQQVRDSLKSLQRVTGGAQVVKLRAFVAGSGDQRRVQAIVSETFTERKLPLPALSVIQVGALPMEGAQVLMEAVAVEKKPVNPNGLAFVSGQQVQREQVLTDVAPLADESLGRLHAALKALRLEPAAVLRTTCFASALNDVNKVRERIGTQFPRAAITIVQLLRAPGRGLVECEAVARLNSAPSKPLEFVNPPGVPSSPNYSQVALVGPGKLAITGTQLAFHAEDNDVRLAFERLKKALEQTGATMSNVAMSSVYPLSQPIADKVRKLRFEFLDPKRPPASTLLIFEGLPSLDASFAIEVVAVI